LRPLAYLLGRRIDKLSLQSPGCASGSGPRCLLPQLRDQIGQVRYAGAVGRNRAHDGRGLTRAIGGSTAQRCFGRCSRRSIGLVDDQNVGDLENSCLGGLHVIARTRCPDDDAYVGQVGHFDF
jgi:hypothetical protein